MKRPNHSLTIFAGVFGNALEWYDFTIYSFFAPLLATLFFPTQNKLTSLILTFSVFAAGFLVRPLGAIFFGYFGDHFGRKKALITSIILMSVPTLLLAFLPTYQHIGLAAPILLSLLRLLQGTAISGELTTATSYLVEHAPAHRRGLYGSLIMCSAFIGIVFSAMIAAIIESTFTSLQIADWGWRIAFLIGGIIGLLGMIIRLFSEETTAFQEKQNQIKLNISIYAHLSSLKWKPVFLSVLLTAVMAVGNYFLIAFFNVFFIENLKLSPQQSMIINAINLFFITLLFPVAATISDKIGRKKVLATGILGLLFLIYPIFWLLLQTTTMTIGVALFLFDIFLACITGLIPTTLAELFETHHRNAALCIGYNLSLAIFGGTTPIIAMLLINFSGSLYAPCAYLMACAILSFCALFYIAESHKKHLL